MKNSILFALIIFILFTACENNKTKEDVSVDDINLSGDSVKINLGLDTITQEFIHPDWEFEDSSAYNLKYTFFKIYSPKGDKISNNINYVLFDLIADTKLIEPLDSSDYNNAASNLISEFNQKAYQNGRPVRWQMDANVNTAFYRDPVLSFKIERKGFINSAPEDKIFFVNFNVNTGQLIKIRDIIRDDKYLDFLEVAEQTFRNVYNLSDDIPWSKTNFIYWKDGFKLNGNFMISETGLYYYFNPNDITSANSSAYNMIIPYDKIDKFMKKNTALNNFR